MRAFDKKFKCPFFINIPRTYVNYICPSVDERLAWCYRNIPEERLWDFEIFCYQQPRQQNSESEKYCDLRLIFEDEGDAMAFKLVWM